MILNLFKRLFTRSQSKPVNLNTDISLKNISKKSEDIIVNRNLPKVILDKDLFESSIKQDIVHYNQSKSQKDGISQSKFTQGIIIFSEDNEFLEQVRKYAEDEHILDKDLHRINLDDKHSVKINLFNAPTSEVKRRCTELF